jgi:hypothetical protein
MSFMPLRRHFVRHPHAVAVASTALCALLCAGCANPGPPRPPSLHLPALVTDLTAERIGDHVELRWTTPSVTTDGLPVKGAMSAQICREVSSRSASAAARVPACAPILSLAVAPGASEVSDLLQGALRSDPVSLLVYRIRISNASDRSAGNSAALALAAGGSAPPAVEDLKAVASERGALLEWDAVSSRRAATVELRRVDLSAPPAAAKSVKEGSAGPLSKPGSRNKPGGAKTAVEHPEETRLRAPETVNEANPVVAGTVDPSAKTGDTYTYTAQRVRLVTVAGHSLEIRSEPSGPVTLALRDVFPPKSPTGLATISGIAKPHPDAANVGQPNSGPASVPYVDLSWEANAEPDLAGYYIYRQRVGADGSPQGARVRLTPTAIAGPSYRDVAVIPGQRYIYQVTAVDASGNESAPSAKAQDEVTPESNSPN